MFLNALGPGQGSKKVKRRLGRGIGSTDGKTCGKGHKGQKARAGGFHKVGFEGGQMPLQRRLPKVGFRSNKKQFVAQVRLGDLAKVETDVIDLGTLKALGLVRGRAKIARLILAGLVSRPLTVTGIVVTKGARAYIEKFGGRVDI